MNIKIPACKLEFPQNSFNIVVVRMNNKKRQLMVDKKYFYEKNCVVDTVPSESFIFASVVKFFLNESLHLTTNQLIKFSQSPITQTDFFLFPRFLLFGKFKIRKFSHVIPEYNF